MLGHLGIIAGHLRQSWAILRFSLTHLGAILGYWKLSLGPKAFYGNHRSQACSFGNLGGLIAGTNNCIFVFWGAIVWTSFWIVFEIHLVEFGGLFWDQIGSRRGQDELKTAIKSFEDPKTCTCKVEVFRVCVVRGRPG